MSALSLAAESLQLKEAAAGSICFQHAKHMPSKIDKCRGANGALAHLIWHALMILLISDLGTVRS